MSALAFVRRMAWLPFAVAAALPAQQIPGYTQAAAGRERALEAAAIAVPTPASARAHSKALSSGDPCRPERPPRRARATM